MKVETIIVDIHINEPLKDKHTCRDCGCNLSHRHISTKYCRSCSDIRRRESINRNYKKKKETKNDK